MHEEVQNMWLRLFRSALFRAWQLLVYAVCKEGSPKNRGKKLPWWALPWKMRWEKKRDLEKKWDIFLKSNMRGTYSNTGKRSLYDQGVPERSRWVQEVGNMFLAKIRLLRTGQKLAWKKHVKTIEKCQILHECRVPWSSRGTEYTNRRGKISRWRLRGPFWAKRVFLSRFEGFWFFKKKTSLSICFVDLFFFGALKGPFGALCRWSELWFRPPCWIRLLTMQATSWQWTPPKRWPLLPSFNIGTERLCNDGI